MTEKDQIVQALRATLISVKGALTLKQCNRDYRELQGEWIPFKKLGYPSLEKLFLDVPGFKVEQINGEWYVDAIPTQESAHIVSLVSRQKSSQKKPKISYQNRFSTKQAAWRRPTTSGYFHSNYNNQYSNQYYSPKSHVPYYNNNYGNKAPYPRYSKPYEQKSDNKPYEQKPDNKPYEPKPAPKPKPSTEQTEKRPNLKKAVSNTPVSQSQNQYSGHSTVSTAATVPPVSKENGKSKVTAAQRMTYLRESLVVDTIPLPLPATNNEPAESQSVTTGPVSHVGEAYDLEPPPNTATGVEKLEWTCRKLGLPDPIYKIVERKLKREPVAYDCTIKVGSLYTVSSYPTDCASGDSAKEVTAMKMLTIVESSEAGGLPTAPNDRAMSCLADLVSQYDAGLWASTIPHFYREKFGENLPANWQDLVESCPRLVKEKLVNGIVILAQDNEIDNYSSAISIVSEDYYDELPPLQFPDENFWNVYVTVANSPLEVWLRIIGPGYCDVFEDLLAGLSRYYSHSGTFVDKTMIVENTWYAANVEEGGWQRAKVLEVEGDNVAVFLGDHGDDEIVHYSKLKLLEPQFRKLPPQAILCRLEGLEELTTSTVGAEIVRRRLLGEILVAEPGPRDDPGEPTVSVVLYDTSTSRDLNVNKEIIQDFCIAGAFNITQKLMEVEVGCVTDEGRVWVSRAGGSSTVRAALAMLTAPGPYRRQLPASPQAPAPAPNTLYIVRTVAGDWVRCVIISELDSEGTVRTQLVDSGMVLRAPLSSLVPLQAFSPALSVYPRQAVQVRLGAADRAASGMVARLRELLLETRVLCRGLPSSPSHPAHPATPHVELYVRTGPQNILASVNNAILVEFDYVQIGKQKQEEIQATDAVEALHRKKERIFTRSASGGVSVMASAAGADKSPRSALPQPVLPAVGKCFDLYIAMAANPWNFVVQSNSTRHILQTMMATLQNECPKLSASEAPINPASGELYTVFYDKDSSWYRVVVAGAVSTDLVSVYFCDYGDLALFSTASLRPVPRDAPLALSLPPQAIKARLHDIKPLHQDWTVEDCIRFQELCVEQQFVGMCKKVERDPLNPREPLITLELIDTSTKDDIYLNKQLVAEGRALLESES